MWGGCAGRRGQDVLLTAWKSVLARVPDARLVLVGEGPDHARLADHASAYGYGLLDDGPPRTRPDGHHLAPGPRGHATNPDRSHGHATKLGRPHAHATNPGRPGGHHPAPDPGDHATHPAQHHSTDQARPGERAPAAVLFVGAVADVRPWYRAADLVVLPSRWEGMALAPLEAMACGRAVVVTDVDGAREGLPPALVPHCLVPPMDAEALADAVSGLLLDAPLRASIGRRGRAHVLSTHDVRHTAAAITAVYDDLLGDGRTPGGTHGPRRRARARGAVGRRAHRVQGVHAPVTAESTVPTPAGQPRDLGSSAPVSVLPQRAGAAGFRFPDRLPAPRPESPCRCSSRTARRRRCRAH